ncbi:MAG TPA: hypothetical protein VIY07_15485, partial [Pseudolabrys sp.]
MALGEGLAHRSIWTASILAISVWAISALAICVCAIAPAAIATAAASALAIGGEITAGPRWPHSPHLAAPPRCRPYS